MTYLSNGVFDASTPSPDPNITNCDQFNLCDGWHFQRDVVGRTDEEVAARELKAKAFVKDMSGIDVDDPAVKDKIMFKMFQIDPRMNLHMVAMSGETVPSSGWKMNDGGWIFMVMDPAGLEYPGGQYAGYKAGQYDYLVFAEYVVDRNDHDTEKCGFWHWYRHREPLIFEVTAMMPMPLREKGFMCALSNPKLGEGMVQGLGELVMRTDTLTQFNISGTLTFPAFPRNFPQAPAPHH